MGNGLTVTTERTHDRIQVVAALTEKRSLWDVLVIGGGATGLGCAVEAASRGYRTVLLEAHDFAKGTSSRSTKLVHGGVRYLRQGNIKLVVEALRERGRMLRNAPHLAHRQAFVIPAYHSWEVPFYGIGLTAYDLLAHREGIGRSRMLSAAGARAELPGIPGRDFRGGILYYDGQFDDARYAITLLRTLFDLGGAALNYAPVRELIKTAGKISGVMAEDSEAGTGFSIQAKVVVNATGIFADSIRHMDDPSARKMLTVSQGSHLVLPRAFLPGRSALMIPRTADGRVLFAIPWHDRVVVGTTDDPVAQPEFEPRSLADERQFLLDHTERFLGRRPEPSDVLSVWSGQRPLVQRSAGPGSTAAISRDHTVLISPAHLVTVTGGKWTTYRKMGQDTIDRAAALVQLPPTPSRTAALCLHGWMRPSAKETSEGIPWRTVYGADRAALDRLEQQSPELSPLLHPELPFTKSEVLWAVRFEMARTVEDVLARRTRALFLHARASLEAAEETARLLARELGRDERWQRDQVAAFERLAQGYLLS